MRWIVPTMLAGSLISISLTASPQIAAAQVNAATISESQAPPIEPLLPPGVGDFDLELYGKYAYLWQMDDGSQVVEILGSFSGRMGPHTLKGRDAVIWFRSLPWQDRRYIDSEIFIWQDAEVVQRTGTVETGPALLVTLRTFGRLLLNVDSQNRHDDSGSELYREASLARRLLEVAPAESATESETPVLVSPSLEQILLSQPKPRKKVSYRADQLFHEQHDGQSVVITYGNLYVSQGSPADAGEYLELRADAAVVYLQGENVGSAIPGLIDESRDPAKKKKAPSIENAPKDDVEPTAEPKLTGNDQSDRAAMEQWVKAVYLEGDVVLSRGNRMIRADRLYYDFSLDRALILDAVTRAMEPARGLPIYVRAEQIRQLNTTTYQANNANISMSEFHTPHIAIGAREIVFEDLTPRNERGEVVGVLAGKYAARDTTLNVEGTPLAYWPYSSGSLSADRQSFRRATFGYNENFGGRFETQWFLFDLLGVQPPEGYDATLRLDYFTKRGPAVGIDVDYQQDDYYGLYRGYYIHDTGSDRLGPTRGGEPDHENRGRSLWRHRQFLPQGWELTAEASYISDDQYLENYERQEFENAKEQETLLRLLKRQDTWQYSLLTNWRINEFDTQTEHLPENRFTIIGEPVGEFATFYSDNRLGVVRYRRDEREIFNTQDRFDNLGHTGSVLRGDTRQEAQFPLPDLGPIKLTPFIAARGTGWDDSPRSQGGGGVTRGMIDYGIHANAIASKVYEDVRSELFDLNKLKHTIKGDITAFNAHANKDPMELTPFDSGVEDVADFGGVAMGLRQRWQTKRGGPGNWRTVDWMVLDLEAGFFNNAQRNENTHGDFIMARPEDSISSNFLAANYQYRLSDTTMLVYDGVYDLNRDQVGTSSVSFAVEREPRLAYFAGWRYIHDTHNNLAVFGANYKLNEKHTVAFRETYDIDLGRNHSTQIIYIRKWPRFYTAVAFDVDRTIENTGVNLSIWPEGAPQFGLGSKRYTGLTDSVGINLR
ncbi:MAG: hypothetical protein KF841_05100 [Phycisphaerae bacterium]|nr:hypothetical protein [Phycisphaerae bacterium]